ncbi:MAG: S9 family peptidase, partial [Cyanobacteria bacterium P01_F01_bin.42]
MTTTAPYGAWRSPISSEVIVSSSIRLGGMQIDGSDIYWSELRPTEAGRSIIVRRTADGETTDITPADFNVRTRVHEYGGGAYWVDQEDIFFANFLDQRLYQQSSSASPQALTPETAFRYADGVVDRAGQRLICVREDHTAPEAVNTIVAISLVDQVQTVLVSGSDFYSSPRLSPDGKTLSWLSWNHPNMPWDGTELWVAEIGADGTLSNPQAVAGGLNESIFQPQWSPDGVLHFVGDATGWWNLYRWSNQAVEALCPLEAEFGEPHWVFGMSTYGFTADGQIVCTYKLDGAQHLAQIDPKT